ncbi:DUF4352 domain-containing protein, partial [Halomicrococcus sp. NG-SE-24]|uniref:DUF4352 domain-containing protein n=1 Tax=Halomicrococcus sp. NG-SE-24 TaxID=3436928 RepID=UPI003D98072F
MAASALTLLAGCAGTGSNTTTSSSTKGDGSSSSQGGDGTSESKQKQKKASVKVGEVVEGDNLAMVVREVEETEKLGEFQKAKSGNTYRVIRMAVKNTSGDYIDFNGFLQAQLKDDSNHVYDATVSSTDHPIQSGILAAGEVARGDIVFEVPKDASGLNLQFDFTTFDLFNFNRVTVALDEEAESIANLEQSLKVDVLSPGKTSSQSDVSVVVHGVRTASELGSFAQAADGREYV